MPEILINGPAGRLQGRYTHSRIAGAPLAIVLHPHPEHGGTMNNKITYALFQGFAQRGFSVLRFNFRGVGHSQGTFDKGEGELGDAAAALDWLQEFNPNAPYCWVAGFSFGAWIGMQLLMRRPEIRGFVSVSPPASLYDFSFLAPCPQSGLIIQGNRDDIVCESASEKLAQKIQAQKGTSADYRVIDGANHFYHGRIDQLMTHFHDYMNGVKAGPVEIDAGMLEVA